MNPYRVLARKRAGEELEEAEIRAVVAGCVDGSWSEGQLAAFLMASAIRGLSAAETRALTLAMLESGERWDLASEIPNLGDKHSTGGVGDKVSLVLAPLAAACGQPVVMLTGRGLGHTGGTADKLETVPGLDLGLDRERCLEVLSATGMAVGVATERVAPADRRLYALRDGTATVESISLITASILSKKLATGAAALVFDVKTGNGAFLTDPAEARALARSLVEIATALGRRASVLLTDMSQPLGRWVGHAAEVAETLACLGGEGPPDLMEVVFALCEELGRLAGRELPRAALEAAIADGSGRRKREEWVAAQGGDAGRLEAASRELAPTVATVRAPRAGYLAEVATRRIGLLVAEAGGGRMGPGATIDPGVSLEYRSRLGRRLAAGEELARLYTREPRPRLVADLEGCFSLSEAPAPAPALVVERISG